MTDAERRELVRFLRDGNEGRGPEAADEIERLVKELASFKDAARAYSEECDSKIADLKACIEQAERERDALIERIAFWQEYAADKRLTEKLAW